MRASLEKLSLPVLTTLNGLPRAVVFLVVLALMVGGAFLPWGWVLLALVALFLAWLLVLGWPRLSTPERLLRLATLAIVVAVTLVKAFPRASA